MIQPIIAVPPIPELKLPDPAKFVDDSWDKIAFPAITDFVMLCIGSLLVIRLMRALGGQ